MGEVIRFPERRGAADERAAPSHPTERVFESRGWRILEVPSAGQFLAVSDYCRHGLVIGRFDPRAGRQNHHEGTEIAILTRCAGDESAVALRDRLAECRRTECRHPRRLRRRRRWALPFLARCDR